MDYACYKYKKKKKRKLKLIYKILIILFVLIFCFIMFFIFVVNPMIGYSADVKANSIIQAGLNDAVAKVFDYSITYDDLVDIFRDSDGNITDIEIKSTKINSLAQQTVQMSEVFLDGLKNTKVGITLGTMTGIKSFAGFGPTIDFTLVPVGSVTAKYKSVFESEGINQTRHAIYVEISSVVSVLLPLKNKMITTTVDVYVAENIIVGKVPAVYLSGGEKLKLAP